MNKIIYFQSNIVIKIDSIELCAKDKLFYFILYATIEVLIIVSFRSNMDLFKISQ